MKIIRQLLRQPAKFVAGLLMISIGVAVLSVCLGQAIAAGKTEETLEYHFTTVALPTTKYNYSDSYFTDFQGNQIPYVSFNEALPAEITDWISHTVQTRGDLIKAQASPGLASAYLPELTPDNVTGHNYYDPNDGGQEATASHRMEATATHACAMLEIVLEEIEEPQYAPNKGVKEDGTEISTITLVTIKLSGTIQRVVSLEDGYDDPTGRKIHISMHLPSLESLEALHLEEGGRYLVAGYDYLDGDWALRGKIAEQVGKHFGYYVDHREIDTDQIIYLSEEEIQMYFKTHPQVSMAPEAKYSYHGGLEYLTESDLDLKDAVTLTIRDEAAFGDSKKITHDDGSYYINDYTRYITDETGNKVQITEDEWQERYQIPTIAPLDSTVKEFLASDAGAIWKKQLEQMKINYHAFPVIGVEKLGHIADFARETARVVDGRDFTEEELREGAKVCILSASLAAANGLMVGDTISPQFYDYDYDNPNQGFISDGVGVVNPWAYKYANTTQWTDTTRYTIIGLYRQDNAWGDVSDNLYSFTPNTIFVPHSSVTSDMDYGNQAFFQTLILQNGKVAEFRSLVNEAGYEGLYVYYDQGYTAIADTLMNYQEVAQKAMIIGLVVYGVILLLFLLLFPGSQGRTLNTMNALGAKYGQRIAQVFFSGLGILLPGSIVGCLSGTLLWGNVVNKIAESIGETVTLEMEPMLLAGIALTQLALALLLTLLLALPMSLNQGIRKRK